MLIAAELVICFWAFAMDKTGKHYMFKEGENSLYLLYRVYMLLGGGDIE